MAMQSIQEDTAIWLRLMRKYGPQIMNHHEGSALYYPEPNVYHRILGRCQDVQRALDILHNKAEHIKKAHFGCF